MTYNTGFYIHSSKIILKKRRLCIIDMTPESMDTFRVILDFWIPSIWQCSRSRICVAQRVFSDVRWRHLAALSIRGLSGK